MKQRELEKTLDAFWQRFGRSRRFNRGEWAQIATAVLDRQVDPDEISGALQSYRVAKRRRFDISAQGYGVRASWGLLGVHNHASQRRKEVTEEHATYVKEDALRRQARDFAHEVLPALHRNRVAKPELLRRANAHRGEVYRQLAEDGLTGPALVAKVDDIFEPVEAFFA